MPDAGRLHDYQGIPGRLAQRHRLGNPPGQGQVGLPGGDGAHEDPGGVDGVHADAVAQQRPARPALGGVHRKDGHGLLREILQEAPHQLVGERGLPRTPGAGNAQHGHGTGSRALGGQRLHPVLEELGRFLVDQALLPPFVEGEQPRQRLDFPLAEIFAGLAAGFADHFAVGGQTLQFGTGVHLGEIPAGAEQVADHPHQPHLLSVFRGIHLGDAIGFQFRDFRRNDGAAAPGEHLDMPCAVFAEQIDHVLEELQVSPLVGTDGDSVYVLLEGGVHDFPHRAVVTQMHHLGALALDDAAHYVDCRVVPVEEAGRRDDADGGGGPLFFHALLLDHALRSCASAAADAFQSRSQFQRKHLLGDRLSPLIVLVFQR